MAAKMSQGRPGAAAAIKANVSASKIQRIGKPRTIKGSGDYSQYRLK